MEAYYSNQSNMPYFSGYYRQRGSGFGALASGIGRFALPLARKYLLPVAKSVGRELLLQGAPELINVVTKRKSPKEAIRTSVKNTIKKQVGGGKRRKRISRRKSIIPKKPKLKRSRSDFFARVKNLKS